MNRGIKPIIKREIRRYLDDQHNGYAEYEDIPNDTILENVAVETDMTDWQLLEDLYFDVIDGVLRDYNQDIMVDRQVKETDKREALLTKYL